MAEQLLNACLEEDIILNTPEQEQKSKVPLKKKKNTLINKFSKCPDIYNKDSLHPITKLVSPEQQQDLINQQNFNFTGVHIYRTVKDIVKLENKRFRYEDVRVIGIYKSNKNTHDSFLQDINLKVKIEIDLKANNNLSFPEIDSTIIIFGSIKYKPIENGIAQIPYIIVKFWQLFPKSKVNVYGKVLLNTFRPEQYDETILFNKDIEEMFLPNYDFVENISFNEIETTLVLNMIESDELLFYEIERLMNIDFSLFD